MTTAPMTLAPEREAARPQEPAADAPWDGAANRARRALLARLGPSALWGASLGRARPAGLARALPIRWPGDATRGAGIVTGEFRLEGEIARADPEGDPAGGSPRWQAAYHGFGFLADLAALGGVHARDTARRLVAAWLERNPGFRPLAWRADVTATRLVAWLTHFDLFFGSPDADPLGAALLAAAARQRRHLRRVAHWEGIGAARLQALAGLVVAEAALGADERLLAKPLARLARELAVQILPDGGHVERCPALQLEVLRRLVDARAALRAAHIEVPPALEMAIDRMVPMLRMLRHGDGRLAQFNDTGESSAGLADLALTRSEVRGRPLASAPHSGFQRLAGGKTVVVMDTGAPPPAGLDGRAHAGILAFELSWGRERVVVNCGAAPGRGAEWRRAARNTAAHSTVVVADTNAAEIRPDGTLGRRPTVTLKERIEENGAQWVAAAHDGYVPGFGLMHARQLFLSGDGEDLRGEDVLTGTPGASFAVRFHLHPSAQVSLAQEPGTALIRLQSGGGFRFRAQGAQLSLGESIYLGGAEIRKTQQIVLSGHVGTQGATVRWAFRREARKPSET